MWVYITAPIGAFVVILGEIVTWIDFDESEPKSEPCSYHGEPLEINEFGDDDWATPQ